jgi:hypothetical protein
MKTSIILRFGAAALLVTAGCALLWAGVYRGAILFALATVFFMPRSELTEPIPRHELWFMFAVLFALIAAALGAQYFLPTTAAHMAERVISHPAFLVPLWLLMLWGLFRHWQRQKGAANA